MNWLVCFAIAAMYPRTDAFPGARDLGLEAWVAKFRAETTPLMWLGTVLGALVLQISPLLTLGLPVPAVLLSAERLDQHANKLGAYPVYLLRQAVFLVKMVGGLFWGSHPDVRARIGLPPYGPDPGTWRSA